MSKIIEIEELGFPKSLIIRYGALVSELIDTNDLVNELNEQLKCHHQYVNAGTLQGVAMKKCLKCGDYVKAL